MVQRYSEGKGRIWEDIVDGLIYGSQDFAEKIAEDPSKAMWG
jgi:hypothetical protein